MPDPSPSVRRLLRVGGAKRLTCGFGAMYLEINMGRQDQPA